jgi:hypothetical protein
VPAPALAPGDALLLDELHAPTTNMRHTTSAGSRHRRCTPGSRI